MRLWGDRGGGAATGQGAVIARSPRIGREGMGEAGGSSAPGGGEPQGMLTCLHSWG